MLCLTLGVLLGVLITLPSDGKGGVKVVRIGRSGGFSLVQLMISIAILAILGAFISLWLLRSAAVRELDSEKNRLWQSHQMMQLQFEKDFAAAVIATGFSNRANTSTLRPAYQGIERFPSGSRRTNPNDNDEILVRFERDGHISAPVNFVVAGSVVTAMICIANAPPPPSSGQICLIRGTDDAQEKFDYFSQALNTLEFFSVTNVANKNIVKRDGTATIGTDQISFRLSGVTPSEASEMSLAPPQIRGIETAKYSLSPNRTIIREVRGVQKEIGANVMRLQANYDFSKGIEFGAYWPPTQQPVSSPLDVTAVGGTPQVQWMHMSKAFVSVAYLSTMKPRGGALRNLVDETWSLYWNANDPNDPDNNKLIYSPSTMVLIPGSSQRSGVSQASFGFCPTTPNPNGTANPQVGARCKPDCDNLFDSPDPQSSKWVGYKSTSGSDYCTCAFNPALNYNDYPGDTASGQNNLIAWKAPDVGGGGLSQQDMQNNARVEACAAHYGCIWWAEQKFFPLWAVCGNGRCLQGDDLWNPPNSNGRNTVNTQSILDKLRAPFDTGDPDQNNYLSCRVAHWCSWIEWQLPGMPQGKWENQCKCLGRNLNSQGQPSPDSENFALAEFIRWGNVCNLGYTPGGGGSRACPNTMTAQGEYILRSSANPRGIDQNQMAFCECLRSMPQEAQSRYYQNPNNRGPGNPYDDYTFRSMWTFDMRAQNPAPSYPVDPNSTTPPATWPADQQALYSTVRSPPFNFQVPATDLNFGRLFSSQPRTIPGYTFRDAANNVQTYPPATGGPPISCIDAYTGWMMDMSNWWEADFGCCMSNDTRCNQNNTLRPLAAGVNPQLATYRTFCNARCGNWHGYAYGQDSPAYDQLTAEIDIIRRAVTNTPPGTNLPADCGGPSGGGNPGNPGGSGTPNY